MTRDFVRLTMVVVAAGFVCFKTAPREKVLVAGGLRIVDGDGETRIIGGVSELAGDEGPYFALVNKEGEPYVSLSGQGETPKVVVARNGRKFEIAIQENYINIHMRGRRADSAQLGVSDEAATEPNDAGSVPAASIRLFCSDMCSFVELEDGLRRSVWVGQDPISLFLEHDEQADYGVMITDKETGRRGSELLMR